MVPLSPQNATVEAGTNCQVAGWGTRQHRGRLSRVPRVVNVTVTPSDQCRPNNVCTGVLTRRGGICQVRAGRDLGWAPGGGKSKDKCQALGCGLETRQGTGQGRVCPFGARGSQTLWVGESGVKTRACTGQAQPGAAGSSWGHLRPELQVGVNPAKLREKRAGSGTARAKGQGRGQDLRVA